MHDAGSHARSPAAAALALTRSSTCRRRSSAVNLPAGTDDLEQMFSISRCTCAASAALLRACSALATFASRPACKEAWLAVRLQNFGIPKVATSFPSVVCMSCAGGSGACNDLRLLGPRRWPVHCCASRQVWIPFDPSGSTTSNLQLLAAWVTRPKSMAACVIAARALLRSLVIAAGARLCTAACLAKASTSLLALQSVADSLSPLESVCTPMAAEV